VLLLSLPIVTVRLALLALTSLPLAHTHTLKLQEKKPLGDASESRVVARGLCSS
jgi:hypothetical protein